MSTTSCIWARLVYLYDTSSSWLLFLHTYLSSYVTIFLLSSFKSTVVCCPVGTTCSLPCPFSIGCGKPSSLWHSVSRPWPALEFACCVLGDSRDFSPSAAELSTQFSEMYVAYLPQNVIFLGGYIKLVDQRVSLFIYQLHICLFKGFKLLSSFVHLSNPWHLSQWRAL